MYCQVCDRAVRASFGWAEELRLHVRSRIFSPHAIHAVVRAASSTARGHAPGRSSAGRKHRRHEGQTERKQQQDGQRALQCFSLKHWKAVEASEAASQPWKGGNNIFGPSSTAGPGQPGIYGTQGQPSVANVPGGRLGPVSWTDKAGNLWLFGGGGFDSNGTFGLLNDLWKFDPSAGEWTWILGANTVGAANGGQPGIYGQQGSAAAANTAGGRSGAVGWTDASGNFWLFGGAGFDASDTNGNLNDLWKFSPSSGQWTWVGGSAIRI